VRDQGSNTPRPRSARGGEGGQSPISLEFAGCAFPLVFGGGRRDDGGGKWRVPGQNGAPRP
jgi:hypothetical protein